MISGRFLARYGLGFGLLALPVANLITSGGASIVGMFGLAAGALFWAVVVAKFFDEIIRTTIDTPAQRILYHPLAPDQRVHVQAVREFTVDSIAIGLAGACLYAFNSILKLDATHVLYMIVILAAAAIFLSVVLKSEYTVRLMRALTARRLGPGVSLDDLSTVAVLRQGLGSQKAGQVMYCLDMLEENRHQSLPEDLVALLDHPDVLVRRHVLSKIERFAIRQHLDPVTERLSVEPTTEVRSMILKTMCAVGEADVLDTVIPYLRDPEPALRRGALVGLLRYCGLDGMLAAGPTLNVLLSSEQPLDRKVAANILGELGIASFYRPLLTLMNDANQHVKRAAIQASCKLRTKQLLPLLMDALGEPDMRDEAATALVALGEAIIPELESAFLDERRSRSDKIAIARICGRLGGKKAASFLQRQMESSDRLLRTHLLSALVSCHVKTGRAEFPEARQMIQREAEDVAWVLAAMGDVSGDSGPAEIDLALAQEVGTCRRNLLLLLSLLHPTRVIQRAQIDLDLPSRQKRAQALEVLDNLISRDLKDLTFPLVDDFSAEERCKLLCGKFPQVRLSREHRIRDLALQPSSALSAWTTACVFFGVGRVGGASWSVETAAGLANPDPVVRETAAWALFQLDPAAFRERSGALLSDSSPLVVKTCQACLSRENHVLLTIEKVLILKSVDIFADTPEEVLLEAASLLDEVHLEPEQPLFSKGDTGAALYIVVQGKVRVHEGPRVIAELGEGEVVGELAAIDPEPRMAAVTAVEASMLLRIEHLRLRQLIAEFPEIGLGILRVLCRRLRSSSSSSSLSTGAV